jgi:hypothetical protein
MPRPQFTQCARVLLCEACGAPVDGYADSGDARCEYSGTVTRFAPRDERQDAAERLAGEAFAMSESARLDVLRAQDSRPLVPPTSLAPFLRGGEIPLELVKAALAQWVTWRQRVRAGDPPNESEQLFYLTLLLAPRLDSRHERALLESGLEVLSDKRIRQVLRCLLAELAVLAGDSAAAAEWLDGCNGRPADLLRDSAFRLATCCLATARGDFRLVQSLLGTRPAEVPIVDGRDVEAAMLRGNALERSGQLDDARQQLVSLVQRDVRCVAALRDTAARFGALSLCPRSLGEIHQPLLALIDQGLRPKGPGASRGLVMALCACIPAGVCFFLWAAGLPSPDFSRFFFWAGICEAGRVAAVGFGVRSRWHFGHDATLGFGRLVACSTPEDGYCEVMVDLLVPNGWVPASKTVRCATAVPPGVYPCLMDPSCRRFEICVEAPSLNWLAHPSVEAPIPGTSARSGAHAA